MRGLLVLLGAMGCAAETDNDRIVIGFFGIEGTRTEQCAEAGLLAAPEKMVLTAHLQRMLAIPGVAGGHVMAPLNGSALVDVLREMHR